MLITSLYSLDMGYSAAFKVEMMIESLAAGNLLFQSSAEKYAIVEAIPSSFKAYKRILSAIARQVVTLLIRTLAFGNKREMKCHFLLLLSHVVDNVIF